MCDKSFLNILMETSIWAVHRRLDSYRHPWLRGLLCAITLSFPARSLPGRRLRTQKSDRSTLVPSTVWFCCLFDTTAKRLL